MREQLLAALQHSLGKWGGELAIVISVASLLLVASLVVQAGVTVVADPTIINTVDNDCDGRYSNFDVRVTTRVSETSGDIGSPPEPFIQVSFETSNGEFRQVTKTGEIPLGRSVRIIQIKRETLRNIRGRNGRTQLKIEVIDDDPVFDELLAESYSRTFGVEKANNDQSQLTPDFLYHPDSPKYGQTITFDASPTSVSGCPISEYRWDFNGDGQPDKTGEVARYSFGTDGKKTVTLTVINSRGKRKQIQKKFTVMLDQDGDGVTQAIERTRGTDPTDADTDDDLLNDGLDPLPTNFWLPTGGAHFILSLLLYAILFLLPASRPRLPK